MYMDPLHSEKYPRGPTWFNATVRVFFPSRHRPTRDILGKCDHLVIIQDVGPTLLYMSSE